MTKYKYLAYGSNLHPERLQRRVASASLLGVAFVENYGLRFHKRSYKDGSGKCSLVAGGPGVFVAIYEMATAEQPVLDEIEGIGFGYEHQTIQVADFGSCLTYIATPDAIDDSLLPMDWYREYVIRGARFHNFPDEYVAAVQNHPARPDPDEQRAAYEWDKVNTLPG